MVDAFIDKYATLQTKLDSLDNSVYELLRKSILQEAIQGKLVPQIAEEGSAQELLEQIKAEKQKLVNHSPCLISDHRSCTGQHREICFYVSLT